MLSTQKKITGKPLCKLMSPFTRDLMCMTLNEAAFSFLRKPYVESITVFSSLYVNMYIYKYMVMDHPLMSVMPTPLLSVWPIAIILCSINVSVLLCICRKYIGTLGIVNVWFGVGGSYR